MNSNRSKQKIINIVSNYSSIYGGNFIPSLHELAKHLVANNFKVIFTFPLDAKNRNWINYLKVDDLIEICFINFSNYKKFKKEIRKINKAKNVSILYIHFISMLRMKLLYLFNKKIKLICHEHSDFRGGHTDSFFTKIKRFFEYKVFRKDAKYIFVSKSLKDEHTNKKNLFYVPNALCTERVPCQKIDLSKFKNEHNINDSDIVFLIFAWSPYVKGLDTAIKAFLNTNSSNKKLVVVHGKNNGYNNCVSYLNNKLGNSDFLNDNRIILVSPSEDVFSFYALADAFISSSRSEGFSYSILEALYFDLPVFSTDIDGVQWCKKYKNVKFFNANNDKELSNLINSFKRPKEKKIDTNIAIEFDIQTWCESIIKILANL